MTREGQAHNASLGPTTHSNGEYRDRTCAPMGDLRFRIGCVTTRPTLQRPMTRAIGRFMWGRYGTRTHTPRRGDVDIASRCLSYSANLPIWPPSQGASGGDRIRTCVGVPNEIAARRLTTRPLLHSAPHPPGRTWGTEGAGIEPAHPWVTTVFKTAALPLGQPSHEHTTRARS